MSQTVGALSFCSSLHPPAFTRNEAAAKSKVRQVKSNLIYSRWEKPMEELYNIKVERGLTAKRLDELGVSRWSMWKTGKCQLSWDWQVDQLVYIVEGEVRVVPEGSERYMRFVAGDLVRYPKWFEADLYFNAPYQELYSFRAYGAKQQYHSDCESKEFSSNSERENSYRARHLGTDGFAHS